MPSVVSDLKQLGLSPLRGLKEDDDGVVTTHIRGSGDLVEEKSETTCFLPLPTQELYFLGRFPQILTLLYPNQHLPANAFELQLAQTAVYCEPIPQTLESRGRASFLTIFAE